jgi:alanine dehydrogenase
MSEVAGRMAPMMGAHHLMRPGGGHGTLIGGVPGVAPANVVVIGAGVAGLAAASVAAGLHANVTILDRNLDRLRQVDLHFNGAVTTLASSSLTVEEACLSADIVVGAVLVVGAKAPKLVSNELVSRMKPGSVLVDISVDQGGCFEDTRATTHSDPVFPVHNSLFYCVANMPGAVPATSTYALSNATLPYALHLAAHGWRDAVSKDAALAEGVNIVNGAVTSAPVAEALGLEYSPLV